MSSNLKDARWRLAAIMAEDDKVDFYALPYTAREGYLAAAQRHIEEHGDREMIDRLAAEFRREDS